MTVPSAPARSPPRHPVRLPSHRLCPGMSHSSGQASGTTAMATGDGMPGGPRGVTGGDRQAPWNVAGREGTWRGTNFSNSEEAARMRRTVEPGEGGWEGARPRPHSDGASLETSPFSCCEVRGGPFRGGAVTQMSGSGGRRRRVEVLPE